MQVKNELPSTFKAYRFQQHRWSCGPANLFRKMTKEILLCEVSNLKSAPTKHNETTKETYNFLIEMKNWKPFTRNF